MRFATNEEAGCSTLTHAGASKSQEIICNVIGTFPLTAFLSCETLCNCTAPIGCLALPHGFPKTLFNGEAFYLGHLFLTMFFFECWPKLFFSSKPTSKMACFSNSKLYRKCVDRAYRHQQNVPVSWTDSRNSYFLLCGTIWRIGWVFAFPQWDCKKNTQSVQHPSIFFPGSESFR